MSLENILNELEKTNQSAVERILDEARAKAESILAEAKALREKQISIIQHDAEQKSSRIREQIVTQAELEAAKEILKKKQELVAQVFESLKQHIMGLPQEQYCDFWKEYLLNAVETGDEAVVVGRKEKYLDTNFIAGCNEQLNNNQLTGRLKLSDSRGNFDYGFVLHSGSIEVNCTLEALMRSWQDEFRDEVARELFGDVRRQDEQ